MLYLYHINIFVKEELQHCVENFKVCGGESYHPFTLEESYSRLDASEVKLFDAYTLSVSNIHLRVG